jgi:hypothetical protein
VRLTFVAATHEQAEDLTNILFHQLKEGALNLTLMGKPTRVEEE